MVPEKQTREPHRVLGERLSNTKTVFYRDESVMEGKVYRVSFWQHLITMWSLC
jgi:hypothetical protein